jgi:predicted nucleic acid-binding protein
MPDAEAPMGSMILPDTSVWIDHFRGGEKTLAGLLHREDLLLHPFVIGELALGYLPRLPDIAREPADSIASTYRRA